MPDSMRHPHHRHPEFFTPKEIHVSFSAMGRPVELTVITPNLLDAPADVWGDWGPMYTCRLNQDQRVRFEYRFLDTGADSTFEVRVPTIEVNTPPLVWERETHPFRMDLVDAARGVEVRAWMRPGGTIDRVKIHQRWSGIDALAFAAEETGAFGGGAA